MPNKTFTYLVPEWIINHPLVHHFMRGYFDGDGSISYCGLGQGRTVKQFSWSLLGTKLFIDQYRNLLSQYCNVSLAKILEKDNVYTISYSGNINVAKITKFLYKNSTICLDRKYDKVKDLSI